MVRALRSVTKAEAVALINRDGAIVASDLPDGVSQETFSIMCAAILGAGMTAATELRHSAPHRVLLESRDQRGVGWRYVRQLHVAAASQTPHRTPRPSNVR